MREIRIRASPRERNSLSAFNPGSGVTATLSSELDSTAYFYWSPLAAREKRIFWGPAVASPRCEAPDPGREALPPAPLTHNQFRARLHCYRRSCPSIIAYKNIKVTIKYSITIHV